MLTAQLQVRHECDWGAWIMKCHIQKAFAIGVMARDLRIQHNSRNL